MKSLAAIAALLLLGSPAVESSLDSLAWIAGTWRSEGRHTTLEHWVPDDGGLMLGVSRTIANGKAVGFEFLRIEARSDGVYYIPQPGGKPPTEFRATELGEGKAVFENSEHDHPKVIRYLRKEDGSLRVELEGDEGRQAFEFEPAPAP